MTHVLRDRAVGRMRILRKKEVNFKFGLLEGWQLKGTAFLLGVMKIFQNERGRPKTKTKVDVGSDPLTHLRVSLWQDTVSPGLCSLIYNMREWS